MTAMAEEKVKVGVLVQDGKLLYEMGKLDESEIKLHPVKRTLSTRRPITI